VEKLIILLVVITGKFIFEKLLKNISVAGETSFAQFDLQKYFQIRVSEVSDSFGPIGSSLGETFRILKSSFARNYKKHKKQLGKEKAHANELLRLNKRRQFAFDQGSTLNRVDKKLHHIKHLDEFSSRYHEKLTRLNEFMQTMDLSNKVHLNKLK
jgi:hypothetical protein